MPKSLRIILRVVAVLLGIAALTIILCVDGVDYSSYLHEAYFKDATTRLREMAATHSLVQGELSAGFGRAALTPHIGGARRDSARGDFLSVPLAGYGDRHGKPARGVHDDLFVKAVAIRVGSRLEIMVGADALIIPPEVTDVAMSKLEQELKIAREQVYLSATHTHSSLGGWGQGMVGEAFAGPFQQGVREWFAGRIVEAVEQSVADLKPAAMGQGRFQAPGLVRNRLVGQLGRTDPEFSYALFKQVGGKTAVLGSYSAHATVLSSDQMEFSADYPGCWERAVEQATGGLAVFLAGGVGSHSPSPPEKGFSGAESMGRQLARQLLAQISDLQLTNSVVFGTLGLECELPPTNVRTTDGLPLRPWVARRLLPVRKSSFLQAFRLGDQVWLSTPCDFSGDLALSLKDDLHHHDLNAVVTSFNGDYIGYVIPLKYYHLAGYEPRTMSFFGPNMPDYFDDLLLGLAHALASH